MFKKFCAIMVAIVVFSTVASFPVSAQEQLVGETDVVLENPVATKKLQNPKIRNISVIGIDTAKITWKKVEEADGYNVYRKASNTKSFKKIATVEEKTSIKDKGLMCGFKYDYKVSAFSNEENNMVLSESEKNTKTFSIPVSACKTFEIKRKDFCFPLKGKKVSVTSPYGWRSSGFHDGIDFDLTTGEDVLAWKSGYVHEIKRAYESSWGNFVMIYHGKINGKKIYSGYAHLDSIDVKVGQKVLMGQKIGEGGNTGRSYGSHLHFEIYKGGTTPSKNRVNPASYVGVENKKGWQKIG